MASQYLSLHFFPNCISGPLSTRCTIPRLQATAHLVGFTLAHAGAHSIHPQVGVEVVRAQACVRVHHLGHGHGHGHRPHAAAVHVEENSVTLSQEKPNPPGKQHPPHIRRVTERTLQKKKRRRRKIENKKKSVKSNKFNKTLKGFKKVLWLSSTCRVVLF